MFTETAGFNCLKGGHQARTTCTEYDIEIKQRNAWHIVTEKCTSVVNSHQLTGGRVFSQCPYACKILRKLASHSLCGDLHVQRYAPAAPATGRAHRFPSVIACCTAHVTVTPAITDTVCVSRSLESAGEYF